MGELKVYEGNNTDLLAVARQAQQVQALGATLIASGLLPDAIKKPEAALAVMLQGRELGIGPMYALSNIAIVSGKPVLSAELMAALVRRAGHRIRVVESTAERCTVEGIRRDDTGFVARETFTMEDARRANLGGKGPWRSYPKTMLRWRAISALCKFHFGEVLGGAYAPEELGADFDEEGRPVFGRPVGEPIDANLRAAVETSRPAGVEGEGSAEPAVEGEVVEEVAVEEGNEELHPAHRDLLREIAEVAGIVPAEKLPDMGKLREYAGAKYGNAVKALERLRSLAEPGEEPGEEPGDAGLGEEPVPDFDRPTGYASDDQVRRIGELAEALYADQHPGKTGREIVEETRGHSLHALTASEAEDLIAEMEGMAKARGGVASRGVSA